MAEFDALARLLELGGTGLLAAILWFLWHDYKKQNEFIRELIKQSEAERKVLARHAGLDTISLKSEAQQIRREIEDERRRRDDGKSVD